MKTLINLLILQLALALPVSADWTMFRGDAQLTGVASGPVPEKMEPLWTFNTGGIETTAAIAGGTVYITSLDKNLYALDAQIGALKWKYAAADEIKSSPSVHDGTVYFGDELGMFYAVDAATGQKKWAFRADGGIISSANFKGDRVLFGSYDNHLYCLSMNDGSLLWKLETGGYVHATPAISGENVIASGCDGKLRIVRIRDGVELKNLDLGSYTAASPAVLNDKTFVGTFGNYVLGIQLDPLKTLWRYEDSTKKFPYYSSSAVSEELVVVGGRNKTLYALSPETGKPVWTYHGKSRIDASPVIAGNRVLFANLGGEVIAIDRKTGNAVWLYDTGSPISGSPAVSDGKLVIGTQDGTVYYFGERQKL